MRKSHHFNACLTNEYLRTISRLITMLAMLFLHDCKKITKNKIMPRLVAIHGLKRRGRKRKIMLLEFNHNYKFFLILIH